MSKHTQGSKKKARRLAFEQRQILRWKKLEQMHLLDKADNIEDIAAVLEIPLGKRCVAE